MTQFQTKREILGEWFSNLFQAIGIKPTLGFILLLMIIFSFRIRAYFIRKKDKVEYKTTEKIEDSLIISMIIFGIFLLIKS